MAQNNNNNEIPEIPDQISWGNDSSSEPKYRGATMLANNLQQGAINFKSTGFAKNASSSQMDAFNIPNDISGGAIDISFGGATGSGIKSSYPSIQPVANFGAKVAQPVIKVQVLPNDSESAPSYDGFQPHYAHRSNSMNPIKMQQTVHTILNSLEQSGNIDFYQKAPFVYAGRAFAEHTDCEFLVSIFSDDTSESVVEIRRSSGECFEFGNIESSILKQLISNGAIVDSSESDEEDSLSSFGFGFGALPPLDGIDFSGSDMLDDQKMNFLMGANAPMDKEEAVQILKDAVDLDAMRDILRSNIVYLNEQMAKNEDLFKNIADIISTLMNAAAGNIYDCWIIKMYLGMVSKLISCGASIPSTLSSSVRGVQSKWSNVVKNEVATGIVFEFFPSQQIVRNCTQIIEQLK